MKNRNMKDLVKQFCVIGFRFKIGFHFIRVWASIFSLTFNSMMKGFSSLKRITVKPGQAFPSLTN